MSAEKFITSINKLNGANFKTWKLQIESIFEDDGLIDSLTEFVAMGTETNYKEMRITYERNDIRARKILLLSMDDKCLNQVIACKHSWEIWEKLTQLHERKGDECRMSMQQEFYDMKMSKNEAVSDYISRVESLYNQLQSIDVAIPASVLVDKIVCGLTKQYFNFMSIWQNVAAEKRTIGYLTQRLMAEERLIEKFSKSENTLALASEGQSKFNGKNRWTGKKQMNYKKEWNKDLSKDKCFRCQQYGHWKKECPMNKNVGQEDAVAVMAECNQVSKQKDWIVDSGATQHMTFDRNSYTSYQPLDEPRLVSLGNHVKIEGLGIGTIQSLNHLGVKITLHNVLHVPDLRRKLFSVSAATKLGNTWIGTENVIIVKSANGSEILQADKRGSLFFLRLHEIGGEACNTEGKQNSLKLWHERFGHVNRNSIIRMAKEDKVIGMDGVDQGPNVTTGEQKIYCKSCEEGKQTKAMHPSSTKTRATSVAERLHVDICGPIDPETYGGSKYFTLFKDEYSSYRFIFFMKTKDEFYTCLKKCLLHTKVIMRRDIKYIYSDRGSEIMSKVCQELLLSEKIIHEKSAPHTPQQNGLIERDNRTVIEMIRTMLIHKKLPKELWGEAAATAVYLLNRSINRCNQLTPFEIVFSRKPKVHYLRVFGCLAYLRKTGYQKKLEGRTEQGIMVGYEGQNYKLYNPKTGKFIITRDVTFDESSTYVFEEPKNLNKEQVVIEFGNQNPDTHETKNDTTYMDIQDTSNSLDWDNMQDIIALRPSTSGAILTNTTFDKQTVDNVTIRSKQKDLDPSKEYKTPAKIKEHSITNTTNDEAASSQQGESYDEIADYSGWLRKSDYRPGRNNQGNLTECNLIYGEEPTNYFDAINCSDKINWIKAMNDEYEELTKQKTWSLETLPEGRKPIKCKWVYKVKYNSNGTIARYKARLVAKGYSQRLGLDYSETFSPVARLDSVRILLSLIASLDLEMTHFDVKTAFLYGQLEEEIYMVQPEGYERDPNKVCKLHKSLYGLKQAPREWNRCLMSLLKRFDLQPVKMDSCVLSKTKNGDILIVAIYVDDGLACSNNVNLLNEMVELLKNSFQITIMDPQCFVGLEIIRDRKRRQLTIHQSFYAQKILERFNMDNSKAIGTPMDSNQRLTKNGATDDIDHKTINVPYREAIGSLLYLAIGTRPEIAFAVSLLAKFCESPKQAHWQAIMRVFRYINSTRCYGIKYDDSTTVGTLECFCDSDYAACADSRKSTSGFVIIHSGGPVIWKSTKQSLVATSTTEAEFVAAAQASKEIMWARQLLAELNFLTTKPTVIKIDNQGAIKVIKHDQVHPKTKHIDIKYMFIKEVTNKGLIEPEYISTDEQPADILTKALSRDKFEKHRSKIQVLNTNLA